MLPTERVRRQNVMADLKESFWDSQKVQRRVKPGTHRWSGFRWIAWWWRTG